MATESSAESADGVLVAARLPISELTGTNWERSKSVRLVWSPGSAVRQLAPATGVEESVAVCAAPTSDPDPTIEAAREWLAAEDKYRHKLLDLIDHDGDGQEATPDDTEARGRANGCSGK